MIRKSFVLAIILMLAVSIVACGGGSGQAAEEPADSDTAPAAADVEPTEPPTEEPAAAGDPANGEQLFTQSCSACHGPDATGLPNLGKDLTSNEFIQSQSDEELLSFVKQGRPSSHPDNTTGIDMPPKGGNPALTDEQIFDIIAFLRTLQ